MSIEEVELNDVDQYHINDTGSFYLEKDSKVCVIDKDDYVIDLNLPYKVDKTCVTQDVTCEDGTVETLRIDFTEEEMETFIYLQEVLNVKKF